MKTASTNMIYDYWDQLRGSRAAPERGEIEPGAVRQALLDTFIMESTPEGLAFRLAGTRLSALFKRELKDQTFASLWPDAATRAELARMTDAVMDESAGAIAGLHISTDRGGAGDFELLVLPLRHRGKTHERVMGALSPVTVPDWLGHNKIASIEIRSMRIIWPSTVSRGDNISHLAAAERRSRFTLLDGGRT